MCETGGKRWSENSFGEMWEKWVYYYKINEAWMQRGWHTLQTASPHTFKSWGLFDTFVEHRGYGFSQTGLKTRLWNQIQPPNNYQPCLQPISEKQVSHAGPLVILTGSTVWESSNFREYIDSMFTSIMCQNIKKHTQASRSQGDMVK